MLQNHWAMNLLINGQGKNCTTLKKQWFEAREKAQWITAVELIAVFLEYLGSIQSIDMVAHKHL